MNCSPQGTTPEGASNEREAAAWVRAMFGRVAHRYDLANHVLSFNMDRYWRAHTVSRVRDVLTRPEARVLDICCGTGDLVRALHRSRPAGAPIFGSDFCHPMLLAARAKLAQRGAPSRAAQTEKQPQFQGGAARPVSSEAAPLFEADALHLPIADRSLDLVTVGFGFRNLANYQAGLAEMRRVLRAGGVAAILEFSQPPNALFGALYGFYSRRVLPAIGGALSGSPDAYAYLPESVRKFPSPDEFARMMRAAGFDGVEFERLTGGIVALHLGRVGPQP